jgi:hypothetical protein
MHDTLSRDMRDIVYECLLRRLSFGRGYRYCPERSATHLLLAQDFQPTLQFRLLAGKICWRNILGRLCLYDWAHTQRQIPTIPPAGSFQYTTGQPNTSTAFSFLSTTDSTQQVTTHRSLHSLTLWKSSG